MKDLVYPAVFIKDKETPSYTVTIPDLGIVTEGSGVVDAFIHAKEYLCAMVDCAIKFGCELETPSSYEDVCKKNKKYIVLLVDALS